MSKPQYILLMLTEEEADRLADSIAGDLLLIEDDLKNLKKHEPQDDDDVKVLFFYANKYEVTKRLANKIDILLEDF